MKNLPKLCGMLIFYRHVSYDIVACDNDTTLLIHPSDKNNSFVKVEEEVDKWEGCYLHYNTIRHIWVRSGKVVGSDDSEDGSGTTRNYKIRQDEHSHCARYDNKTSRFYSLYPHSEAKSSDNIRRGYWHHLNQYC